MKYDLFSVDGNFLLFSKKQEIRGVDLQNATFNVIPALTVPFVYNPLALDYDFNVTDYSVLLV